MAAVASQEKTKKPIVPRSPKKKSTEVDVVNLREDSRYFVDMSVPLTGFNPSDLYGTGMADTYLNTVLKHAGATVTLRLYQYCDGEKKVHAGDGGAFTLPDDHGDHKGLASLACTIAKLWYLGAWYGVSPDAYAKFVEEAGKSDKTIAPNEAYMVSAAAYENGLLWGLTGGHVPGAKPTGFGSWANKPAPIPPTPTGEYEETV